MNYREYCELIKDVGISDDLRFCQAVMWLHPQVLPLGLVSTGESDMRVIKVPEEAKNRFDIIVPVICIAREAFAGNENVTDIILPSTIRRLPEGAFAGCRNLKNITIPKTIRYIKEKTFDGCVSLENVYYEGNPEEWDEINIVHQRHEIEFGETVPGTPVRSILAERRINIPGNEALLSANIHFRCDLSGSSVNPSFQIKMGGKDITDFFLRK